MTSHHVRHDTVSFSLKGVNSSLLVSLTGSDTATLTEVALVELSGSAEVRGVVETQSSGNFLVHINMIPSVEFVVRVKGQNVSGTSTASEVFQRQFSTGFRSSNLTITVSPHPREHTCSAINHLDCFSVSG